MAITINQAINYNFPFAHPFKGTLLLKVSTSLRTIYLIPLQNPP